MAQRAGLGLPGTSAGNSPIGRVVGASDGRSSDGAAARLGQRGEHRVGVEAQQARVVAHEAAHERAAGQLREVAVLERPHLARRELQLLRDGVDRQPGASRAARSSAPAATARRAAARRRRQRVGAVRSLAGSRSAIAFASGESG